MMKKKTLIEFINEANTVHNLKYDYSNSVYNGSLEKIEIICPKHGAFWQLANAHLQGQGCKFCRNENFSQKYLSNNSEFINIANTVHNNQYSYDKVDYIRSDSKVIITCHKHGDFLQTPNKHLLGFGCRLCGFEKISEGNKFSTEDLVQLFNEIHNNYYDYSKIKYSGILEKIEIVCPKHGSFWQRSGSHLQGHGCPTCNPRFSNKEQEWLDFQNLPNDKNHRQVKIMIDDRYIIVDGYNSQTNTIYEFYGDFWHGNPVKFKATDINPVNKRSFGELLLQTKTKEFLIKKAGYNLVYVWENEWNERNQ